MSVIIPSYRSGATLGQVLAAMSAQLAGLSYEIIVVDSASDGQAALLASAFPVVRVIEIPERLSCGAARNRGRQAAQGRLVLFVDADCVPAPDWGQHLRAAVARDPDILSGTIANGTPGSWSGSIQYWVEFSRFTPGGLHQERPFTPSFHLLLRRELLETLPPYPEDFLLAEDLVFDSYLKRAGLPPRFDPQLVVAHQNRQSFRAVRRHLFSLGFGSGRVRSLYPGLKGAFLRRAPFIAPLLIPYTWLGIARRLLASRQPSLLSKLCLMACILPGVMFWNLGFIVGLLRPEPGSRCYLRLLHPAPPRPRHAGTGQLSGNTP